MVSGFSVTNLHNSCSLFGRSIEHNQPSLRLWALAWWLLPLPFYAFVAWLTEFSWIHGLERKAMPRLSSSQGYWPPCCLSFAQMTGWSLSVTGFIEGLYRHLRSTATKINQVCNLTLFTHSTVFTTVDNLCHCNLLIILYPLSWSVRGSACPELLSRSLPAVPALWILPITVAQLQHRSCHNCLPICTASEKLLRSGSSTYLWVLCQLDCLLEQVIDSHSSCSDSHSMS